MDDSVSRMTVDALPLRDSYTDGDEENLKILLKTFGSVVSLEDIASAYCESSRNLCTTVEMLTNLQSRPGTSSSKSEDGVENVVTASSGCTLNTKSENAYIAMSKPKKCSATLGTVSDVIGKDYLTPKSQSNGFKEKAKPVKLNVDHFPASEIRDEKNKFASTSSGESVDGDIQEFLFKMLGNGFQLEMDSIQDVVGQCGYDMPMSIDKLLEMSATTLEKSDDVIGMGAANSGPEERLETIVDTGHESILPQTETNKKDVERELLEALFHVPGRIEEKSQPTVPVRPARRSPYGTVVTKPLEDTVIEDFTFITRKRVNDRSNESSYEDMRKAVMEYWAIMKEYYKAALDAFLKKDYKKAERHMEEGNFYMRKAREADEESAKKLFDGDEEEITLNMIYFEPRDALQNLRLQLTCHCGISSISCIKVVVGTGDGNKKDEKRKRLIIKQLEKEGIPWTEDGNEWTISFCSNKIDPKKLSFANK